MSRSESKPKVGFATHITAGGIAGMAEAVGSQTRMLMRIVVLIVLQTD